jgi:hypothetical protein
MSARSARQPHFQVERRPARPGRNDTGMRVNGEPERWVVAARLSRVAKKDRERGDALIDGIQTQEIIERVTRELDALREAGKLANRFPFGYTSAGDKYDRYLTPTDEGRTYIPQIFQHCIDGWSMETIAEWLNGEGVKSPSGGKWWGAVVGRIIKNPTYMGHQCQRDLVPPDEVEESDGKVIRYRYGSTWTETPRFQYGKTIHRCEALVDAAIWKRANEALVGRPKRGHVDPQNRAMLSEALFCPFCEDSPMYRIRGGGGKSRYLFYYRCSGRGSQRQGCGNMVRLELVDAAVSEIMASTFDVPVMRHDIVYGNEAEIEAEIERINFELQQLGAQRLPWDEEDRERARLRAEHERVSSTTLIDDHVELVETDDTYLELWERRSVEGRGPWLIEQGFRVTASKEHVTVSQGTVTGEAWLDEPERITPTRHLERVYWGKCECGCGTDLYGAKCRQKRYVNGAHRMRAIRQRDAQATGSQEA